MSVVEQPLADLVSPRNLLRRQALYYVWANDASPTFFFSSFVSICIPWINSWNNLFRGGCHQTNAMPYLWFLRKLVVVNILPENCWDTSCILCLFKGKGTLWLEGCWNKHWIEHISQICNSKIFLSCWFESVTSYIPGLVSAPDTVTSNLCK